MSIWKKLFGEKKPSSAVPVRDAVEAEPSSATSIHDAVEAEPSSAASIHDAVEAGDFKAVKAVVKANPDAVSSKDEKYGNTALHIATQNGDKVLVEFLVANRADVNAKNKDGFTPLHTAAGYVRGTIDTKKDIVRMLLAKGADANAKANNGTTPLHRAAHMHTRDDIVGLLVANGADVNAKDNNGETPLHWSLTNLNKNMIGMADAELAAIVWSMDGGRSGGQVLLANKADVNAKDNNGTTPLHIAAELGWRAAIGYVLLENGADVNAKDGTGKTPLDLAVYKGHNGIIELLRKRVGEQSSSGSALKDEDLSFESLVRELVFLSRAGYDWGRLNHFPAVEEYPQYSRIRRLGELIHAKAGCEGMQEACHILRQRVVIREGGGQYLAEHGWAGIGDWRP